MPFVQHLDAQDKSPVHRPPLGTRGFSPKGNGTSWKPAPSLAKFKWQVTTLALFTAVSAPAATAGVRTVSVGAVAEAVRP